ncbi:MULTISPECIES: DUF1611 domain-containing protein [unclassified Halomonas]|uniref:DUF1611 domain-containing protein n=1 Tax=unclassified Halomonas TaxID=2609666 RepID=UPI0006DA5BBB|nr:MULTISPECIES: DUF1611 domain-containing protein [unclassified Halomonas]KPQ21084.1 MAG: hypothetical protein HLUCCO06_07605 [Halomonas sp. HL-93]SBR50531.1 Uncharacterized conserved protein, NAD-dependent epimerase/dehydratase family [Halomonas sp. HL-93]SNY96906.1 Uncharacterized conserved protein, NAD-dependent epimerase/dehydratase family [Halomonas sp. hl-4]
MLPSSLKAIFGSHTSTNDTRQTAIVYCEGNFTRIDGKTANGLVRSSEKYRILCVIDSTMAGTDAGLALGMPSAGIPIVADLTTALADFGSLPDVLIFGLAPLSGLMSEADRAVVLAALTAGVSVVSGLHEFLADDPEMSATANAAGATLYDIRRPRPTKHLRMFDGAIANVDCIRIAVLGTDGAIGKRTTSTLLTKALNEAGIHTVMVGTGQTGLMQGAAYGVALDAIPAQFGVGELEGAVMAAYEGEHPDVIVIEGQGALSHPAYLSSTVVLRASRPQAVIMQHAPARKMLSDYPDVRMPTPESEIQLIELFGQTKVIGLAINHEDMSSTEVLDAAKRYQAELGIPATDALWHSPCELVAMVTAAFPTLKARQPLEVV